MALKPDRNELQHDISKYMNVAAEAGGVVVFGSTSSSGVAMDGSLNVVEYAANPSGKIAGGILLGDIVDLGEKTPRNFYKDENDLGSKVTLLTKGWVVTDMIYPGTSPTAGATAYIGQSGLLTPTNYAGSVTVGRFETAKDEDGFSKVSINIP